MKKSESVTESVAETLRKVSPLLAFGLAYYVLAVLVKLPYKVWIPAALGATIIDAIVVFGRLYKPFLVNKKGKCIASRDSMKPDSVEKCRHYFPGSQFGGCARREENGLCRLRMR